MPFGRGDLDVAGADRCDHSVRAENVGASAVCGSRCSHLRLRAGLDGPVEAGEDGFMPVDDVTPFHLAIAEFDLDDRRARLGATRWPEPATDPAQGVALQELQALCAYWADGYDWRRAEARLNGIGQFRTTIDGLGIHFLHARSPDPGALPLVLTHGWGSVIEFLEVIGPLNEAGYHCVVPSLPRYGWSDKPAVAGWSVERIARAWATLMARLAYDRDGAQGSDWGTSVSASLGQLDAEHVAGIHLMPPLAPPHPATLDDLTDQEQDALDAMTRSGVHESGYSTMHRTRPQTTGYALTDSPAGLAAWYVEKLVSWTDPRSELSPDAVQSLTTSCSTGSRAPRRRAPGCTGRACTTSPAGSKDHSKNVTWSTRPPAAACSPTNFSDPRGAGPRGASATSCTGTNPNAVATSPPWNNRRCSSPR
jgi:pimeloyl-ACP methyl ester carboxylesterase